MARINSHYRKLKAGYLFPEITRRVNGYREQHPDAPIIKLGIGDVTEPLAPAIVAAIKRAADEMASRDSFRGYAPYEGYEFLRAAIAEHDYAARGVSVDPDEVFVSDGSKPDSANFQEILAADSTVAVADPAYPVYVDANVMAGRTGPADDRGCYAGLRYLPATEDNGFVPDPPDEPCDIVYLCSPNNPTGAAASREALARWVGWAREHDALIVFDAAYEAFITDPALPRSIFEIPGARECAVEMRSFSKRAGFTGVRCAYTVVPRELTGSDEAGERVPLRELWNRRHNTKFNGVSYVVQRAAAAVFTPEGRAQTDAQVAFYMENARVLREGLAAAGFAVHGGVNAPYIWLATPEGQSSWAFFDDLLRRCHVVGTPGSGFGPAGEGFFRLSAFNARDQVEQAVQRIQRAY